MAGCRVVPLLAPHFRMPDPVGRLRPADLLVPTHSPPDEGSPGTGLTHAERLCHSRRPRHDKPRRQHWSKAAHRRVRLEARPCTLSRTGTVHKSLRSPPEKTRRQTWTASGTRHDRCASHRGDRPLGLHTSGHRAVLCGRPSVRALRRYVWRPSGQRKPDRRGTRAVPAVHAQGSPVTEVIEWIALRRVHEGGVRKGPHHLYRVGTAGAVLSARRLRCADRGRLAASYRDRRFSAARTHCGR